jgi:hypothetical protein
VRLVSILLIFIAIAVFLAPAPGAQEARICAGCGNSITGAGFETRGEHYHSNCFACGFCNQAISGSYVEYDRKNYHDFCFKRHIALQCTVCGDVIRGAYLIDYWGNAYHRHHQDAYDRCDFCRRFMVGAFIQGMAKHPDGRMLCGVCAPSAVTRLGEARMLMRDVSLELARHGLDVAVESIELQLAGQKELRSLATTRSYDTTGFVDYVIEKNLFGVVTGRQIKIYILHGMPKVQAAAALAHELTHVWQFMQGRLHVEKALSEGSANYASYLALMSIGGREAEYIIENMLKDSDPVYGEGFRRVKTYAEREGVSAWLDLLKSKKPMLSSF